MTKLPDASQRGPESAPRQQRAVPEEQHRPWGFYEVLADRHDHHVKRITVWPGKRLSLQPHRQRAEHWHLISGDAIVTVNGQEAPLRPGDSVNIASGAPHGIQARGEGPVVFIEVQRGDEFGEDEPEPEPED